METIAAIPSGGLNGMSAADIKALVGDDNGFGGNGNGLLALLILFGLFGNGGFGNNSGDAQQTILRAIDGSDADIRFLGAQLNTDVTAVQTALGDIKTGLAQISGSVISSSKDVINAIQSGNCTLSKELAEYCCNTQRAIDNVNLNMCNQTNALTSEIINNRFANQMGFTNLGNEINKGFANQAFQTQAQTTALQDTIKAEGAATRNLIRDREFAALEKENAALRLQASQTAQTKEIEEQINAVCGK